MAEITSKSDATLKLLATTENHPEVKLKEHKVRKPVKNTRSQQNQKYEAESAVFNNPLLLQEILTHVVNESKWKRIRRSDVATVRFVARNWLQSTSCVLKRSIYPVIQIELGENCQVNQKPKKDGKTMLESYFTTFVKNSDFKNSLLTADFIVYGEFFRKENFQSLKNFFNNCGESLFGLTIYLPASYPKPLTLGILDFPILRNVTFHWFNSPYLLSGKKKYMKNTLELVKSTLSGAKNLKQFKYYYKDNTVFKNIDSIRLPPTTTSVNSYGYHFRMDHGFFMKNNLPNLQELKLDLMGVQITEQDLFTVIDRFRATLKCLLLYKYFSNANDSVTFLRLPILEKLQLLTITSSNLELSSNMKTCLSKYVPNLKKFHLCSQTENGYLKWIENSRFETVRDFEVLAYNEEYPIEHDKYIKSPSLRFMNELLKALPNVQKLHFFYNFDDIKSLKILFRDCIQLKELAIEFKGKLNPESTQTILASTFLGIPSKTENNIHNMLRIYPDSVELKIDSQNSIFNLKELTFLGLERYQQPGDDLKTFIGLFSKVLIKLPNLTAAEFTGAFKIELTGEAQS